jgi:plasmid stabilization system protein ParE
MSRRIVLRPEAQADLLQAQDWYEQEGPELAEAFADFYLRVGTPID